MEVCAADTVSVEEIQAGNTCWGQTLEDSKMWPRKPAFILHVMRTIKALQGNVREHFCVHRTMLFVARFGIEEGWK